MGSKLDGINVVATGRGIRGYEMRAGKGRRVAEARRMGDKSDALKLVGTTGEVVPVRQDDLEWRSLWEETL